MQVLNFDNEIILHCSTCGSSFFDKDGIHAISKSSAQKLSEDAQGHYVLGNQKACPKDGAILVQKLDDPSITKNTILLECPSCKGIFAYPDDLLKYKGVREPSPISAASMKLLPAPRTIFMLSVVAVLSLAFLMNITSVSQNFSTGTRADEQIKKIRVDSDRKAGYVFVAFTTESEQTATIIFTDKTTGKEYREEISKSPKRTHTFTTSKIDLSHDITYKIILGDAKKPTVEKRLEVK